MIRLNKSPSSDAPNPKRQQAEAMMARLKRVLETETGRGYVTVNHYLTARSVVEGESAEVQQQAFMPRNDPGTGFYELENVVATGGMGAVLSAKDKNLQRTVALKVMLTGSGASDDAVYRFVAEAQITGQLEHPNIVPLHEMGVAADGTIFYTMKLIDGTTLRDILQKIKEGNPDTISRYDLSKLLTIFQKVCDGMAYAHSRNVVHRDLKPDNVMIGSFGEVLILDWGLAKVVIPGEEVQPDDAGEAGGAAAAGGDGFQTMAGQIKGTPNYMAPEQAEGRVADIDIRTDIYALGAILYTILTLHPPVSGTSLQEILDKVTSSTITSPTVYNTRDEKTGMVKLSPTAAPVAIHELKHMPDGKIPSALSAIAMKCLSLLREDRYPSTDELQLDIAKYQGGYATSAEDVNPFQQLMMLARRKKKEVGFAILALVLMVAVAAGFMVKVLISEKHARDATAEATRQIEELQKAAPTFYAAAKAEILDQNFTNALDKITYAIKLNTNNAEYFNLKGNILQTLLRFPEAQDAYVEAKNINPTHANAEKNRSLCGKLSAELRQSGSTNVSRAQLFELYKAMVDQKRGPETTAFEAKLGKNDAQIFSAWQASVTRIAPKAQLIKENNEAQDLRLDLSGLTVRDLTPLRGIPISFLSLSNCVSVEDISVLKGMPLRELSLTATKVSDLRPIKGAPITILSIDSCANIFDLTPLEGMPLTRLTLDNTSIAELAPLKGAKLTHLSLARSKVRDLSPLQGMKLTYLNVEQSKVIDLTPLKGMPIAFFKANGINISKIDALAGMPIVGTLDLSRTLITDLGPLKGMRIEALLLEKTSVGDVAAIRGMPLKRLNLSGARVKDISPVESMPLSSLNLADTLVSDLSPLSGLPLDEELDLSNTPVINLAPLRGLPLKKLLLQRTEVSDLTPLAQMPLLTLRLDNCAKVQNLLPLWDCQQLVFLSVHFPSPTVESLRQLPNLKRIGYEVPRDDVNLIMDAATFWADVDKRKPKPN